jgi:FtsP/CotA-like multicopper oxidase with cupredoxin domain
MRSARTSNALQFLTVGVALGLIATAVVASIEVGESDPVEVAPAAGGQPAARPLGTALGQQSQDETDLGDGVFLAAWQLKDGVKEFHLDAGRVAQGLAFNGHTPGPTIRVNKGDRVRITVTNHTGLPTGVHWYGLEPPKAPQPDIEPGQSVTYEYIALSTGLHWYHSEIDGDREARGLDGALEVMPSTAYPAWEPADLSVSAR